MKRWIIRSFFIGILMLLVGGWVFSYKVFLAIRHNRAHVAEWSFASGGGKIRLTWVKGDPSGPSLARDDGWFFYHIPDMGNAYMSDVRPDGHYLLGFGMRGDGTFWWFFIPFWFLTSASAGVLWFVWRKTRPKVKGRAFPVDLPEPRLDEDGRGGAAA